MAKIGNPALKEFVANIGSELILAQVIIRRGVAQIQARSATREKSAASPLTSAFAQAAADKPALSPRRGEGENGGGYELRHVEDAGLAVDALRLVTLNEVRALSQCTATGEFRPLKSAPTLPRGWRLVAANDADLEAALSRLYPGAVADWHAARSAQPPVTNYRDYANRQSGMFRVTAKLTDAQVAEVIKSSCDTKFCLKRRLWTVTGLEPDAAAAKSLIPCLEPCAVLMEAARRKFRAEQPENAAMKLAAEAEGG